MGAMFEMKKFPLILWAVVLLCFPAYAVRQERPHTYQKKTAVYQKRQKTYTRNTIPKTTDYKASERIVPVRFDAETRIDSFVVKQKNAGHRVENRRVRDFDGFPSHAAARKFVRGNQTIRFRTVAPLCRYFYQRAGKAKQFD